MARVLQLLLLVLSGLQYALSSSSSSSSTSPSQWPLHDNGLTTAVQWDHYSFYAHGQRFFLFSGEFHYWRIPVPSLWRDILEKIKAMGFTGFAFYASWAYHAPNNHTVDFSTGAHDIRPIYDLARELGMYIIVRPGPYVNAEASAGGFPLWLTTGEYGSLRNDDARYTAAWTPYLAEISEITSKYQVSDGKGNAFVYQIENEYGQQWVGDPALKKENATAAAYMALLEQTARKYGVTIPLSGNDPNMHTFSWGNDWSSDLGNLDVVGVDSYPSCWSCDVSECTGTNGDYVPYKVMEYYSYFEEVQPTMPKFMPEFQGGSYNPWSGPEGGCTEDTGADFANLFYRWNIAQGVTAMSLYMLYGGTNWGGIAAPVTATSYDYSAPISEDRSIGSKYAETKLLGLFTRCARDLAMTDRVGNGSALYTDNAAVSVTELRNPETNAAFYVTVHTDTTVDTDDAFHLKVNTSAGALSIPRYGGAIHLDGHQSKIVVTDFTFGDETLLYSTAEVLTYAVFDKKPTLVLWVPTGESGEFLVKGAKSGTTASLCPACKPVQFHSTPAGLAVAFNQSAGMSVVELDKGARILLLDRTAAYDFWAPALTNDPLVPETDAVLVSGPYLVRSAQVTGSTLALRGDSNQATTLEVFAPANVKTVSWNGKPVRVSKTKYGSLRAQLAAPPAITLPLIDSWLAADSLPERFADYDDSGVAWVAADHMTTLNPNPPATLPVLYADEYGFHNGIRLWRGYFNASASGVYLNVQGGNAFGWSAWLNGHLLGSHLGSAAVNQANGTLLFPTGTLSSQGHNVLLVVHDDTGHDETSGVLNPRGILEARLLQESSGSQAEPEFTHWRVTGTAGGNSNLDPVRGVYNEDGLHGERLGWHLPGFSPHTSTSTSTTTNKNTNKNHKNNNGKNVDTRGGEEWTKTTSLSVPGAGIRFFRTVLPRLSLSHSAQNTKLDVSISFVFSVPADKPTSFRAQLFVNGYQYGRFNPYVGNQVVFPVPVGVLDYTGENTVAVAVWAQTEEGAEVELDWRVNYVLDSSLDVFGFEEAGLRPGWNKERLGFA